MADKFRFDGRAVTAHYCAALQFDRICLGVRIVDETGERQDRKFYCKHYHDLLEKKDTFIGRRRVVICKRCDKCLQEHSEANQPDFDEVKSF